MVFLENLNTSQLRAVQQEPSELLIFAGPGSGKTRVLTSRIAAFVLERDFLPSRLRAVTFTRAATVEMRERLNGYGIKGVTITTLHGLAREVINKFYRSHPHLVKMCAWAKREAPLCWIDGMDVTQLPLLDPKKDTVSANAGDRITAGFRTCCTLCFPRGNTQRQTSLFAAVFAGNSGIGNRIRAPRLSADAILGTRHCVYQPLTSENVCHTSPRYVNTRITRTRGSHRDPESAWDVFGRIRN